MIEQSMIKYQKRCLVNHCFILLLLYIGALSYWNMTSNASTFSKYSI